MLFATASLWRSETQRSLAFALLSFKSFPAYDELLLSKNLKKHFDFTYFSNVGYKTYIFFVVVYFFSIPNIDWEILESWNI